MSWAWGGGKPSGEVAEVANEGEIAIQSSKGNTIKKNADPDDPAVHISRQGNDVVKRAHELQIEEKADKSTNKSESGKDSDKKAKQNENASQTSKKRSHSEANEQNDDDEKNNGETKDDEADGVLPAKKQDRKSENQPQHAHQPKRGRGRPKGATGKNGEKAKTTGKKREPRKAATSTGEPRRSSRHKD